MCQKPVDVYCVHYDEWGRKNANLVTGPDGQATPCPPAAFTQLAKAQGQPCYIGEYGVLPMRRNEKEEKFWAENPGWFTSFEHDPQRARQVVTAALDVLVEARPGLAHWWCYQSNRDMDQRNLQRMDIDLQRNPELHGWRVLGSFRMSGFVLDGQLPLRRPGADTARIPNFRCRRFGGRSPSRGWGRRRSVGRRSPA